MRSKAAGVRGSNNACGDPGRALCVIVEGSASACNSALCWPLYFNQGAGRSLVTKADFLKLLSPRERLFSFDVAHYISFESLSIGYWSNREDSETPGTITGE